MARWPGQGGVLDGVASRGGASWGGAGTRALLSLAVFALALPVAVRGTGLQITAPGDGEKIAGEGLRVAFAVELGGFGQNEGEVSVELFLDGHKVYNGPAQQGEQALEFAKLQAGFRSIEAQLVFRGGGDEAQLGFDSVEVMMLGGGTLAPNLDDTALVAFRSEGAADAALEQARTRIDSGDVTAGVSAYRSVISRLAHSPSDATPRAYAGLAAALLASGDAEGALSAFRDAVWHSSDSGEAHAGIAALLRARDARQGGRGDERRLAARHERTAKRLGVARLAPLASGVWGKHAGQRLKVGLMTVASGAYARFSRNNTLSADAYLLPGVAEIHYFVFTDSVERIEQELHDTVPWKEGRVKVVYRVHDGWPSASLKRFHTYFEHAEEWRGMDYVFATDVDVRFVSYVGREILGETVGTLHADNAFFAGSEVVGQHQSALPVDAKPGSMWRQIHPGAALLTRGVYETRPESRARMAPTEGNYYFAGGFYGGVAAKVETMLGELVRRTDEDTGRGIVAIFHDESLINRYWFEHPPAVVLSAAYLYPEPTPEPCWTRDPEDVCVRDEGHPWLWSPWRPSQLDGEHEGWTKSLWNSHRRFPIRCLNLSKDNKIKGAPASSDE